MRRWQPPRTGPTGHWSAQAAVRGIWAQSNPVSCASVTPSSRPISAKPERPLLAARASRGRNHQFADEVDDEMVAVELSDFTNEIGADVPAGAAATTLVVRLGAHHHAHRQGAVAGERQMSPEQFGVARRGWLS